MFEGNLLEVRGKRRRCKGPRSREIGRGEPAAGHEVVNRSRLSIAEDVAFRVADPDEIRSLDDQIVRFAGEQNELRRRGADEPVYQAGSP